MSGTVRPRPPTRAERRQRNREALLSAAAAVFAARGFRVATIDDVAAAAGLTKGAVYSHFDNKHDLFAAAIERRYRERLEAFRSLMDEERPAVDRAQLAALDFARSVTADADWALLFLEAWAEMLRDPAFGERLRQIADETRDALAVLVAEQLAAAAPGHDLSPTSVAEMVLAMTHGFGIEHRLDPRRAPASLFAEMMGAFSAGIALQALTTSG